MVVVVVAARASDEVERAPWRAAASDCQAPNQRVVERGKARELREERKRGEEMKLTQNNENRQNHPLPLSIRPPMHPFRLYGSDEDRD